MIIFIPVIYFIILLAAVGALGLRIASILYKWIIPIIIICYLIICRTALKAASNETDGEERVLLRSVPVFLVPIMFMVYLWMVATFTSTGGDGILAFFFTGPLAVGTVALMEIGIVLFSAKFHKIPILPYLLVVIGNIVVGWFLYECGLKDLF